MAYMLISGKLTEECLNTVLSIDENKHKLEEFAQRYVIANPGTVVHIFNWVSGYQSEPSVSIERLWSSGYVQPPLPEEDPVPETLPTIDPSMESQAG